MKKFEIVSQKLKDQITSGFYTQGQTLPTEEELSEIYSVSRQTVRKALDILVAEELISKKQGSGSTVRTGKCSRKSFLIAVIATYIDDYIFPGQLRAVESVLSANGYTPILAATGNKVYNERMVLKDMLKKPIDGLLIEGTKTAMPSPNLDLYAEISRRNLPVVFFNACCSDIEGAVSVCADDYQGGYDLVKILFEKGHRNIAGIFKSDDLQGHERYSGFISSLRDLGILVPDEKVIWYTTESKEILFNDSENILSRIEGATAVVCYNDEVALSLIKFLFSHDIGVPEDVAVVSFDNSKMSEISPVRISSLSHGEKNIGRIAAQKLIDVLNEKKIYSEKVPWTFSEKESSR